MQSPTKAYPNLKFGEDMQTMYDTGWTGATVVYAGHQGVWNGQAVSNDPAWGPYEHLRPASWPGSIGENYRRCCTSIAWVGQALALKILQAEALWDHDEFFDYADRWMTEDDAEHIITIQQEKGLDYSANWQQQGYLWDNFQKFMWITYRNNLPTSIKGKVKQGYLDKSILKSNPSWNNFEFTVPEHLNNKNYNIVVYDQGGQEIWRQPLSSHQAHAQWNGTDSSGSQAKTGVYFYSIVNQDKIALTGKVIKVAP